MTRIAWTVGTLALLLTAGEPLCALACLDGAAAALAAPVPDTPPCHGHGEEPPAPDPEPRHVECGCGVGAKAPAADADAPPSPPSSMAASSPERGSPLREISPSGQVRVIAPTAPTLDECRNSPANTPRNGNPAPHD